MNIKYIWKYQDLAGQGKVDPIMCPMHEDKVYELIAHAVEPDSVEMRCNACNYVLVPGVAFYDKIIRKLVEAEI